MSHEDLNPEDPRDHALRPIAGHFTCLGEARIVKPKWIIDEVATTGLTFIIGPPKDAFKTTIEMAFALLIARHQHAVLPREWKARIQGPVLIFEDEGDAGELKDIVVNGMGVRVPNDESIMVADRPEEFRLDDPQGVEQMIHWCEERDVAACMLGPLANFHSIDEKDSAQMIHILQPLRRWAKQNDAGFFVSHHTRKIEEGKTYSVNDARGTSAILGLVDNMLVITPGKEPYELLISRKGKKGPAWEKTFFLNVWDRRGKSNRTPFRAVEKMILRSILQGYVGTETIVDHIGLKKENVLTCLKTLRETHVLSCVAGTWKLREAITLEELG